MFQKITEESRNFAKLFADKHFFS